ncbi:biotin--[acetyl-CoA-carboxylase] ligase [Ferrovum myxofaciens]|uniref:biotin--[acetyl-CoA-carboxylase] ligase n=1 Tax=Ferrovum myxofaciens TaxID=416213 RepID=UPI0007839576|nr:biotin--[acetyl-CoA-carboxylase] ligase [Ferrovum myxofaciens]
MTVYPTSLLPPLFPTLVPLEPFLDESALQQEFRDLPSVPVLWQVQSIDSTNRCLLEWAPQGLPQHFCLVARQQSAGRGRRGRAWISDAEGSLTFSLWWIFDRSLQELSGLPLAVSLGMVEALHSLGMTSVGVKWPNDLWREGRKVAGVLVETTRLSSGQVGAVIGIGLNVALPSSLQDTCVLSLNDLRDEADQAPARATVLGRLLNTLIPLLESFAQSGFAPFAETWMTHCVHRNQQVTLLHPNHTRSQGECVGLSSLGGLILRDPAGEPHTYHGGELSLRLEAP